MLAVIEEATPQQILSQIEQKRKDMIHTGKIEGLTCENTLQQSKELDELILLYQQKTMKPILKKRMFSKIIYSR